MRLQEARTLGEGLGRGVSGLLDLRAPRARVCPAGPPRSAQSGQLPGGRQEAGGLVGHRGPRLVKAVSPSLPSLQRGIWGRGTVWLPGLISLVPVGPHRARGPRGPRALGSGVIGQRARGTVPTPGPHPGLQVATDCTQRAQLRVGRP